MTRSQGAVLALIIQDADESSDSEVRVFPNEYSRRLKASGHDIDPGDVEVLIRQLKSDGFLKFIAAGNLRLGVPDLVRPTAMGTSLRNQVINLVNINVNMLTLNVKVTQVILTNLDSLAAAAEKQTPPADHEQLQKLTKSLRSALDSREPKLIQQSLADIQAWALANPADRAIAVIGLLLGIIGIVLGLN